MPVSSPPPALRDVAVVKRCELPTVRALLDRLTPFASKISTRLAIASAVPFKNKQFNKTRELGKKRRSMMIRWLKIWVVLNDRAAVRPTYSFNLTRRWKPDYRAALPKKMSVKTNPSLFPLVRGKPSQILIIKRRITHHYSPQGTV